MAANNGHLPMVQLLVEAGADMNAKDKVRAWREGEGMLGAQTGLLCV